LNSGTHGSAAVAEFWIPGLPTKPVTLNNKSRSIDQFKIENSKFKIESRIRHILRMSHFITNERKHQ